MSDRDRAVVGTFVICLLIGLPCVGIAYRCGRSVGMVQADRGVRPAEIEDQSEELARHEKWLSNIHDWQRESHKASVDTTEDINRLEQTVDDLAEAVAALKSRTREQATSVVFPEPNDPESCK